MCAKECAVHAQGSNGHSVHTYTHTHCVHNKQLLISETLYK